MSKNVKDLDIIDVENTYIFSQKEKAALRRSLENVDNKNEEKEILLYVKLIFVVTLIILILLIYFIINILSK